MLTGLGVIISGFGHFHTVGQGVPVKHSVDATVQTSSSNWEENLKSLQ